MFVYRSYVISIKIIKEIIPAFSETFPRPIFAYMSSVLLKEIIETLLKDIQNMKEQIQS
jgi:hypothetical protein